MRPRFLEELSSSESVLLAGAGGGYDIFCGLPLYFYLKAQGVPVHLANLSFTDLWDVQATSTIIDVVQVTADSAGPEQYFPERYLCEWFASQGEAVTIHCLARTGVAPLTEAYASLVAELGVDTVVLVDGGTDSLMRGDEAGLGTPQEDIASILSVAALEIPRKFLACIGFGVDRYHGVCHAQFLEAVAELTRADAFLGAFSVLQGSDEVRQYRNACDHVFNAMPHHVSIVNASILSSLSGYFGDHHATDRTSGSQLWINPLMSFYWGFFLDPVAQRCLYTNEVAETESWIDLDRAIHEFRERLGREGKLRNWDEIPA